MNAHRITTTAGTLAAAVTLAATAAPAIARPDLGSDGRAAAPLTTARQDLRSPDARDAAERVTPVVVHVSPRDTGLVWDSAAIGALVGAGLMISIVGGGVLVTRRRPRAPRLA